MKASMVWTKSPVDLGKAVVQYGHDLVFDALVAYLKEKGAEIAAQMQREASWTDRTGEARRGLRTEVEINGTTATLYLITSAAHGKYLELRWGGRYAIVSPTIPRAGIEIMGDLKRQMAR